MGEIAEYLKFMLIKENICVLCSNENCTCCVLNYWSFPPECKFELSEETALELEKAIMEIREEE